VTEPSVSTTTSDCPCCQGSGQIRAGLTCPSCWHWLMNMGEIAEANNVSLSIVRRWVSAGYLKPVELPLLTRRKLFRRDDVLAFVASCPTAVDDGQRTQDEIAADARSREIAQNDEDGFDDYTGDNLPIVVRAGGIIDVIENRCNITTEDAEFERAMRSERDRELRAAGVDMERLAKLEGAHDAMLQQRADVWTRQQGRDENDGAVWRLLARREAILTKRIDATHAEIVKTRGY